MSKIRVRNADGQMVPLGSLVTFREIAGPERVPRYNLFPTAEVNGTAQPGVSSGQALQIMRALAAEKLPQGVTYEWTDLSYQEAKVGTHRLLHLRAAASSSCSWRCPPSTRAGRCRSPSC